MISNIKLSDDSFLVKAIAHIVCNRIAKNSDFRYIFAENFINMTSESTNITLILLSKIKRSTVVFSFMQLVLTTFHMIPSLPPLLVQTPKQPLIS